MTEESSMEKQTDLESGSPRPPPPKDKGDGDQQVVPASPRDVNGIVWVLIVISILSSIFLYAMDNTVVADITPTIANEFQDVVNLPWLSVGFLVGGVAAVLPFGRLYGMFDAKWLYVASAIIFNAASALCGAAPNMNALIVGRVFAGVGGNGMYTGVLTLLSVLTSDRERPGYLSFVGLVWGIGTILGPVIGGAFTQSSATWRWAFYLNLCVAALFAPVYLFAIPSWKPQGESRSRNLLRSFDIVGCVLVIAAIVTIIMAIQFGKTLYAWDSAQEIALFVISGALWIVFALQQAFSIFTTPESRIFPVQLLRNWNAVLLYMVASAVNTAGFVPIYYVPLYFQFTRGDDPIDAAVRLLPLIFTLSASILANGHLMGRFGYFQPWYIAGSVLTVAGGVPLSLITVDTATSNIYGFEVLVGIGTGMFIQAGYTVIQAMIPASEMSAGIGFMMLAQLGGIGLGLSIAGAVFVNGALSGLTALLPGYSQQDLQLIITGTSSEAFQSLSGEQQDAAVDIIVNSLSDTFILVYVGGAFALLTSLLFTQRKLFSGLTAIAG